MSSGSPCRPRAGPRSDPGCAPRPSSSPRSGLCRDWSSREDRGGRRIEPGAPGRSAPPPGNPKARCPAERCASTRSARGQPRSGRPRTAGRSAPGPATRSRTPSGRCSRAARPPRPRGAARDLGPRGGATYRGGLTLEAGLVLSVPALVEVAGSKPAVRIGSPLVEPELGKWFRTSRKLGFSRCQVGPRHPTYGAINSTPGRYWETRRGSRVNSGRWVTAACAPIRKSARIWVRSPPARR